MADDTEISIDFGEVMEMLDGLDRALSPQRLTHDYLGDRAHDVLTDRARTRFQNEGDDVSGGPWAELKPYTQEIREKGGFGPAHPINVRTGAMRGHILDAPPDAHPTGEGADLFFPARGGNSGVEEKIAVAQRGDERTVARPVIGAGARDMELLLARLGGYLQDHQPGGGRGMFP